MGCDQSREAQNYQLSKQKAPRELVPPWFTAYHSDMQCVETPWECTHKPDEGEPKKKIEQWLSEHALTRVGVAIPLAFKETEERLRCWINVVYSTGRRFHHGMYIDVNSDGKFQRYRGRKCEVDDTEGIYCLSGEVRYIGDCEWTKKMRRKYKFTLTLYKNHLAEDSKYFCHGTIWLPSLSKKPVIVAVLKT